MVVSTKPASLTGSALDGLSFLKFYLIKKIWKMSVVTLFGRCSSGTTALCSLCQTSD